MDHILRQTSIFGSSIVDHFIVDFGGHIEPILRSNQNGARSGRSTADLVLMITRILEGVKEIHLKAVMVFVDYKKA